MTPIIVPDLGDCITKVEVVMWCFVEGSRVEKGEDLVEVVTDKATFNVAAPVTGVLKKIYYFTGQEAEIGCLLGEIE